MRGPTTTTDGFLTLAGIGRAARDELAQQFASAEPFPHLVLHDVLRAGPEIMSSFPPPEWDGWVRYTDGKQPNKLCCSDLGEVPEPFREILREMSERPFLELLEQVTGIPNLLPDPYFEGGGLHASGPGGKLVPHTDFHLNDRLRVYRRINVLLYLNPEWHDEWGGNLELWDKERDERVTEVSPTWGTMVIFATNDDSMHGFSTPVADDRWRRSIATYYYTSTAPDRFSGDYTTYWRPDRPTTVRGKVRYAAHRALLKSSRALSMGAHLLDPGLGKAWLKSGLETRRRSRRD